MDRRPEPEHIASTGSGDVFQRSGTCAVGRWGRYLVTLPFARITGSRENFTHACHSKKAGRVPSKCEWYHQNVKRFLWAQLGGISEVWLPSWRSSLSRFAMLSQLCWLTTTHRREFDIHTVDMHCSLKQVTMPLRRFGFIG